MITTIGSPVGSAGKAPGIIYRLSSVPEPGTLWMAFGAALAGWLFRRRAQN